MQHRSFEIPETASGAARTLFCRLAAATTLFAGLATLATADLVTAQEETKAETKKEQVQGEKPAKVGRGRLSGRNAPPKPSSVPAAGRQPVQPKQPVQPQQTPSFGNAKGLGGASDLPPADGFQTARGFGQAQKQLTPEQQKARDDYQSKLQAKSGAGGASQQGKYSAAPRPPKNPNAKLEVEFGTDKHDFGRARQGDLLSHTFELKSAGSESVIISQASPTCGCTLGEIKVREPGADVASLYKFGDSIAPGSTVELEATLDTASKRNKTNVRINVYSNDGKTGVTMLSLSANVEPFLVATPQFLQLGDIREGTEMSGTIDFRTSSGERVLLSQDATRPIPLPPGLSVDLQPINADEAGRASMWRASFAIAADSPEGGKSYALRLNSDIELPATSKKFAAVEKKGGQPTVYTVTANVNYRILGALSLQPQYVSMGLVRPGQPVVRNVRLTCHEPDFDLSGVTAEIVPEGNRPLMWADRFAATVKPVSGSNAVDIELRLDGLPEEADGPFRGRVLIKTGHPAKPEDFFRFSGVCRKLAGTAARPVQPKRPAVPQQKKGSGE
ncbi:MAG: DUF1573 domain-containing protein [Planctomycetota bacterium]